MPEKVLQSFFGKDLDFDFGASFMRLKKPINLTQIGLTKNI